MPREALVASLDDRARIVAAASRSAAPTYFCTRLDAHTETLIENASVCIFMEDDNGVISDLVVLCDFPPGVDGGLPALTSVVNDVLEEPCLTVRAWSHPRALETKGWEYAAAKEHTCG